MKEKILKIWKDAVWSKVIAAGMIGFFVAIYSAIFSFFQRVPFSKVFKETVSLKISLWIVALLLLFLLLLPILLKSFSNKKEVVYKDYQIAHDKKLFSKIKVAIPSNGSIEFIRENNFAGFDFSSENLNDFKYMIININDPDLVFVDAALEKLRSELFDKIKSFKLYLSENSWMTGDEEIATVPPEWEQEQPQR